MITYCKDIDITDVSYIKGCVLDCLNRKYNKTKTIGFLAHYENVPKSIVKDLYDLHGVDGLMFIIDHISKDMSQHIKNHDVTFPPIRFSERYDGNSGKVRQIGIEHMLQQCYEYVVVNACQKMFNRKIGRYQCASIPGRGQLYGVRTIQRWIDRNPGSVKYFVKLDVRKCYPSIEHDKIKKYIHRDIKNLDLIYLIDLMIDSFSEGGLSIGSHLSQWLCNYYLSYAYHYMEQNLFTTKTKVKKRLISHQLFYMDDILLCGQNKRHLKMAVEMTIDFFKNELGLEIKPNWGIQRFVYFDKKRNKERGCFIDMMGYKIYRDRITIRKSVFIKIARKLRRINKKIDNHIPVSLKDARTMCSYYGYIVHTNSKHLKDKYQVDRCMRISRNIISRDIKLINYRKMVRIYKLERRKGAFYEQYLQNVNAA